MNAFRNNIPPEIDYYDLSLNEDALKTLDITMSPSATNSHKIIVESLVNSLLYNNEVNDSKLKDLCNL